MLNDLAEATKASDGKKKVGVVTLRGVLCRLQKGEVSLGCLPIHGRIMLGRFVNQVMLVVLCQVMIMCLQVSALSWVQVVGVVLGLYLCCREMPRESGCRRVLVSRALMVDLLLRLEVLIR